MEELFVEISEILAKIDPKVVNLFRELVDPDRSGIARKDRYLRVM